MSEAEKRIRLTVAYDAVTNLLKASSTERLLTRKEIFTADVRRMGVVNNAMFVSAMEKTTWQKDMLKRMRDNGWITEVRHDGTLRYATVERNALARLLFGIEDEKTHVFDAKLHLSALLWPSDVVIPDEPEEEDGAPMESDVEDEELESVPARALAAVESNESDTLLAAQIAEGMQGMLDTWRNLFSENAASLASLDDFTRNTIAKQERAAAESFVVTRKRFNDIEKATEELTNSVNGLMRSSKTQIGTEVKAAVDASLRDIRTAILAEVKDVLNPLYVQNQAQAALIKQLLVVHKQTESTKLADMRVVMKRLVSDMQTATAMFLEVTEEVENGK